MRGGSHLRHPSSRAAPSRPSFARAPSPTTWWRGEEKMSSPLPRSGGGASTGRQAGAQRGGLCALRVDVDGRPDLRGSGSRAAPSRPSFARAPSPTAWWRGRPCPIRLYGYTADRLFGDDHSTLPGGICLRSTSRNNTNCDARSRPIWASSASNCASIDSMVAVSISIPATYQPGTTETGEWRRRTPEIFSPGSRRLKRHSRVVSGVRQSLEIPREGERDSRVGFGGATGSVCDLCRCRG